MPVEYQAIGRKLLLLDELPQEALDLYNLNATISKIINRKGMITTLNKKPYPLPPPKRGINWNSHALTGD